MDSKRGLLISFFLVSIAPVLAVVLKDKYIITVDMTCGRFYDDVTVLTARTDMTDAHPYAVCKGHHRFNYTSVDRATYTLTVTTEGHATKQCVFLKNGVVDTFHVVTYVPISGKFFVEEESPYMTTCNYASSGTGSSADTVLDETWKPPEELLRTMGPVSNSSVDLYVVDVMVQRITGDIQLGQTIGLVADLIGNIPHNESFQTVSCKAKADLSIYPVIIGGCGDGILISKDNGFTTTGRTANSPFFRSFRLPGSTQLKFRCVFVICSGNCDGSSCGHAKRKRRSLTNRQSVHTAEVTIQYTDDKPTISQKEMHELHPTLKKHPIKPDVSKEAKRKTNQIVLNQDSTIQTIQSEPARFNSVVWTPLSKLGQNDASAFEEIDNIGKEHQLINPIQRSFDSSNRFSIRNSAGLPEINSHKRDKSIMQGGFRSEINQQRHSVENKNRMIQKPDPKLESREQTSGVGQSKQNIRSKRRIISWNSLVLFRRAVKVNNDKGQSLFGLMDGFSKT